MATFSVDITDVVFAGKRTGYKDITITGMPEGGVTVSLTGSNPTYFTYTNNPESKGTNVYRVSTKSTNAASTGSDRTANLKITNKSDSTDYVTVSLKQYYTNNSSNGYISYNLSNYSDIYISFPKKTSLNSTARVFFPYSLSDSTERAEIYIDGIAGTVNTAESWISTVKESTYTDTGFTRLLISCINNSGGPRKGLVNTEYSSISIYQNGYPSSTSGCTQSISFTKSGGTESIVLNTSSSSTSLADQYLSDFTSPTVNKIDNNNYSVTIGINNTGSDLTGLVWFADAGNRYIGHTIVTQSGAEAASLTISPTGASVGSAAGTTSVTVTSTGIDTVEYSIEEGWVSLKTQSSNVYTFSYTANTSSSKRSCIITFYGGGLSKTYTLTQEGESVISDMVVSPLKIVRNGGSFPQGYINVRYRIDYASGHSYNDITVSIGASWLTRDTSGDIDHNTYGIFCFKLSQNNSGSDRYSTIRFSDGDNVVSAQLKQSKNFSDSPFELWPDSLTFSANGETQYVAVEGLTEGYSSIITPSWISYDWLYSGAFISNEAMNITASPNTGEERTGYIDFYWSEGGTLAGRMLVSQAGSEAISVSPVSKNVGNTSGTIQVTVTGSSNITYSISDSWLTYKSKSGNVYTFAYTQNSTSSQRTATVTFSASGMRDGVFTLTQAAGAISVSPKSQNVDNTSGTVQVTVTGANNINYSISDSWLTYQSKSGNVYTFSYDTNNNFYSRTATVTFSASGFKPVTYTLNQYGITASFSVIPSSLTFNKEGGSDNLTFFNIPDGGLSWNITYGSGTDWISSLSFNNNVATVVVTENTGTRRNAVIRFYNKNDNDDYLDLNVVQNGNGVDSIWFDKVFEPSSFQVGENYHYRLQDHNTNKIIYEGITVPVSEGEKPLGINIPRLVDSYIHSDELDGLREDMKLRTLNGSLSIDFYDMNGSTPSLVKTFNYWNDWSGPGYNTVYDITKSINDPINHKGCNYMVIPFCIYDDELSSYSVVETKKDDTQVSYPMGTPSGAFMYAAGEFFNAKSVSFKKGNDTLLTYDMDNCGEGFLLYKNRFGGWDSFLIEGNIYKYDEYTRLRGVHPKYPNGYGYSREKMTDRNTIKTRYEINTGWLTDEQAERLVFHLMSSTTVALRSFSDRTTSSFPYNMVSVSIVDSSVEYKKFKNGKKMINYTITLEENDTKQVQR